MQENRPGFGLFSFALNGGNEMKKTGKAKLLLPVFLLLMFPCPAYAQEIVGKITGFGDFLVTIVQAIGILILILGILTFGAGWLAHDSTQQMGGLRVIVGGLLMAGCAAILNLLK